MPQRSLYVNQEVKITTNGTQGQTAATRYLPVQSASCEVTRPIEDILSFGRLGSLARTQVSVSTCKSDIKTYLASATGSGNVNDSTRDNLLDALTIQNLTGQALNGLVSTIAVSPNGFFMSGILTSLGIDISNGQFATADLSFAGVGEPTFAAAPTGATFGEQANMPNTFSPVTSTNVTGSFITGACPSSFKFSLDMPNETISCLGGITSGTQTQVANDFLMVGKPPFKATINVEGLAVDAPAAANVASADYIIGKLKIQLPAGQISSRSFSNAVGQAGASYSYTVEATSATFSDTTGRYP
jgi:hypothetical protein